jgi:PAS domain S-box-containing protein
MREDYRTREQLLRENEELKRELAEAGREQQTFKGILSPEGDTGDLELADIIDTEAIQSLMNNFYKLAGVPVSIIDLKGKVLVGVGWQDICTKFHRMHPKTCKNCIESDTQLSESVAPGEFKLYKCRNNMWDIATPIMVGGKHVGNLLSGQFFFEDEPLDYDLFRSQAMRYGFNEEEYIAALENVPHLSRESVRAGMDFFIKLADMISKLSYSNIKLARALSERGALMDSLQRSEALLRSVTDNSPDPIFLKDCDSRMLLANPATLAVMGKKAEEVIGKIALDVFSEPEIGRIMIDNDRRVMDSGQTQVFEETVPTPRGLRTFLTAKSPCLDARGRVIGLVGVARDITERKQMMDELRRARDELELRVGERTAELNKTMESLRTERQRFNDVLDVLPAYVVLLAPDYQVPFANKVFRQRFGESHGLRCFEHLFGRSEPCEVCKTFKVFDTMEPQHWEWTGPDGRNYDVFDFPFIETDGSTLILEMGIDITERKRAEESLSAYMARLEMLNAELQEFAFVASHDLQEPLRKIQSFGSRLRAKCDISLGEEGCDYLQRMESAANRMQALLGSLLAYSRVTTRTNLMVETDLGKVTHNVLSDLEIPIERSGGQVEVGNLPVVTADSAQMHQLFQNLIVNGLKYSRKDEKPTVRVYGHTDNGVAEIFVEDNGIGFDEKYLDRIFKPFQRLHGRTSAYDGTGMGLAIVRKIVERHGGTITARSIPGEGSTFIVTLPAKGRSIKDD